MNQLQSVLRELVKGFALVAREQKISTESIGLVEDLHLQVGAPCRPKTKKAPDKQGLTLLQMLEAAGSCQPRHHSHSIVAGGLPEMSYTTRLIPRTSLMMRLDTLPSKQCGRCAHCAVMKSNVCTARSATTYS